MDTIYMGVDHHKRYSVATIMNHDGHILWEGQMDNSREAFLLLRTRFKSFKIESVIESSRNWGILYDLLEELEFHPVLAHCTKVRLIADSRIKTDKIDSRALATLLRGRLIPAVCVPPKQIRDQKNLLRHREWLTQQQTRVKNRIHAIVDRNHIARPDVTDLFGASGTAWMKGVVLPEIDQKLLALHLERLKSLRQEIKELNHSIKSAVQDHPYVPILSSLPGLGDILTPLAALEIFDINRFFNVERFVSYSGLAISTYSSGGRTVHGHLIPQCNRHLRFVFIEGAWSAVRHSPYFAAFFKRLSYRIGRPKAIVAVARKLAKISYQCLKEQRPYQERAYCFRSAAVA
jgi:transposase